MLKSDSTTPALAPAQAARRLVVKYRDPRALKPYERNARTHSDAQVRQIRASMDAFGNNSPILLRDDEATIGAGHGRWEAAQLDPPYAKVPTITLAGLTEQQWRAYVIADNKIALNSGWDEDILRSEVSALLELDIGAELMGFDERDLRALMEDRNTPSNSGALAERFLGIPFSVLSAREGWWQERKRAWISLGIQSELGRTEDVLFKPAAQARLNEIKAQARRVSPGGSPRPAASYGKTKARGDGAGKAIPAGRTFGAIDNFDGAASMTGTSIFDPVLCELAYRWFCPTGGVVLDPFAGGSVRGVVACRLGRHYHGIDLRPEQVVANEVQALNICGAGHPTPSWVAGDALDHLPLAMTPDADFLFSCPPYGDLEVYSDDPRDLSNMGFDDFLVAYRQIVELACAKLKPDRFACFVVGDIRDPAGAYRNFVSETIDAFRRCGLQLYNEAILVTAVGSLPVRAGKAFAATRKLGKTHQNILVFCKGNPRIATKACGDVEIGDVEAEMDEAEPEPDLVRA